MNNSRQHFATGRARFGVMFIFLAMFTLLAVGSWWIARPEISAQQFLAHLSTGRTQAAGSMLVNRSSMSADGSNVMVRAEDGTTTTIFGEELFYMDLVVPEVQARRGIGDYLAGRMQFHVVCWGPEAKPDRHSVALYCRAVPTGIVIERAPESR